MLILFLPPPFLFLWECLDIVVSTSSLFLYLVHCLWLLLLFSVCLSTRCYGWSTILQVCCVHALLVSDIPRPTKNLCTFLYIQLTTAQISVDSLSQKRKKTPVNNQDPSKNGAWGVYWLITEQSPLQQQKRTATKDCGHRTYKGSQHRSLPYLFILLDHTLLTRLED
jgi:hypothetical protein